MDDVYQCFDIGQRGVIKLLPFIKQKVKDNQFVLTDKGNLSEFLQKTVGDIIFNCTNDKIWTIEVKTELDKKHPNLFLETWSNRHWYTPGWMITLMADFMFYLFYNDDIVYTVELQKLKEWAFHKNQIYKYPEKPQNKYVQLNDTWGRCVPIHILEKEVGLKTISLIERQLVQPQASQDCIYPGGLF